MSLSISTSQISCHNPDSLELTYSDHIQSLLVKINHDVDEQDWGFHYIDSIFIWLNNVFETSQNLDNQSAHSSYQISFPITAQIDDVFKVTVTCSLGGSITSSLTVGHTTSSADSFSVVIALCTFSLISLGPILLRRKNKIRA